VLGDSTDYSELFAVQVCSVQPKAVVGLHPTFALDSGFAILRGSITRQVR